MQFDYPLIQAIQSIFDRGGPVMYPILACSVVALAAVLNRLLALWRYWLLNRIEAGTQRRIVALTSEGKFDEAIEIGRKADAPICRIFVFALMSREYGFRDSLELAAQKEIDRLRRGISLLDTVITVAPLLGILGTVTGIISSFNMLSVKGVDDPTAVTAGIAEALLTTAAGLIVAILALLPFNFFISQIKRRTHELEQITHAFEMAFGKGNSHAP